MESPYLTMKEKRDLQESIREVLKEDILTADDKREIYFICLHACERELHKEHEKGEGK